MAGLQMTGIFIRHQDNMLAKVARAISKDIGCADWRDCIGTAHAAVSALREPTTGMLMAATVGLADFGYLPDEWQDMIDHVLSETLDTQINH